jgi:hypothetical protein
MLRSKTIFDLDLDENIEDESGKRGAGISISASRVTVLTIR